MTIPKTGEKSPRVLPNWSVYDAYQFARECKAQHAPARQTMPDGRPNPYDRCAVCGFTRHPCDVYDLADLVLALLDRTTT